VRRGLLTLVFVLLPLVEIAGFALAGRALGALATVALVVGASVVGALLLRAAGLEALTRLQADLAAGRRPGRELAHSGMLIVAALLLMLPGFFTDLLALLLLLPPVRRLVWSMLQTRILTQVRPSRGPATREIRRTIELDKGDYEAVEDPDTP
jgi:UPF0716 protein FxsA